MAIFVPDNNIKSNTSFGQVINQVTKKYITPELKKRNLKGYAAAGIEIFTDNRFKIYFDNEIQLVLEFKKSKINPKNVGKQINVDLHDIKDIKWQDKSFKKDSAKILVVHFNKDWWIWDADFNSRKDLENKFKVTRSFTVRGGGYLSLNYRKKEKDDFFQGWQTTLKNELPSMWRRYITVCQRYRGVMVYDGNYFDLFSHAQELYVLGYYYPSIIVSRSAAEQALISILTKSGKGFDIYKTSRGKRKLKSIEQLVSTCRSQSLFGKKFPINKTSAKKLNEISNIASNLVHPKHELDELKKYKENSLKCMDYLQYVIKNHLNFVKDTGTVSGYKIKGQATRLR
jgi:hypothetical protein